MRSKSWSEQDLRKAIDTSTSIRQVLKKLRLREAGGNYVQITKYISIYKIDISHFMGKGWSKGMTGIGKPLISLENILIQHSTYQSFKLKKRLFSAGLKKRNCEECGWSKMAEDGRIPLELDHINGNRYDNRIENLRILCPNCHSLKPTHRGLNRKLHK
ncbi:MAG TPA: HNH endonuclease [Candidatus Levybacteria bacterium]|nr:HNH endonuclease [Candidatus Levybacteria bacterium]